MSKTTDDLIDRILGAANALRGVKAKLSPGGAAAQDVPPPPPPEVTQEDYDQAKRVVADLKGQVEALEAEVSRDSKVPESGAGVAGDTKSKKTIT